jgi:phosphoesterase RecJ-like protein
MTESERNKAIQAFTDRVSQAKRPIIASHVSPDGDAVGSVLGLAHFVEQAYGAQPYCTLHDPVPKLYEWVPGADRIVPPGSLPNDADLLIVADTHQVERTGSVADHVPNGTPMIVIDHHIVRTEVPEHSYLDSTAAAVGEMVGELFVRTNTPFTPDAATACYVALSTDTGCFRYSSTTSRSHEIAAKLIQAGASVGEVTDRVFDTMSPSKFALLARVLDRVDMVAGGRAAVSHLTLRDLEECEASHEDTEGLINFLRNVDGVEVAIFARETEPNVTKVSFRARPGFDASALARHFGGGGHAAAAGTTINLPLAEACDAVIAQVTGPFLEQESRERNLTR